MMPSPPAAPVNCSQSPTSRTAEQRVCKTPSPTTALRSPRRHRRGPALSLPNLKCVSAQLVVDHGSAESSVKQIHRSCSSEPSGPSYECSAPVQLLPHLYLGSNVHASKQAVLEQLGITAVLNVSRLPNYFPTRFRYMQIPVDDNTDAELLPWFDEATNFIGKKHWQCKQLQILLCVYNSNDRCIEMDNGFDCQTKTFFSKVDKKRPQEVWNWYFLQERYSHETRDRCTCTLTVIIKMKNIFPTNHTSLWWCVPTFFV